MTQLRDAFRHASDLLQQIVTTGAYPLVTPSACDVTARPSPSATVPAADLVDAADPMDAQRGGDA